MGNRKCAKIDDYLIFIIKKERGLNYLAGRGNIPRLWVSQSVRIPLFQRHNPLSNLNAGSQPGPNLHN